MTRSNYPDERPKPRAEKSIVAIYQQGRCPFCVTKPAPCAWCQQITGRKP